MFNLLPFKQKNMTYRQYHDKLYKEYQETSDKYLKLEHELPETAGFGNYWDLPVYADAKMRWQIATNNFWSFLAYMKGKKFNPDDEFILE